MNLSIKQNLPNNRWRTLYLLIKKSLLHAELNRTARVFFSPNLLDESTRLERDPWGIMRIELVKMGAHNVASLHGEANLGGGNCGFLGLD